MFIQNLKHPVRSLIGAIAVILSVIGSIILIYHSSVRDDAWHTVSFIIYGASLITLWTVSTLYHSLNVSTGAKRTWEQLDHAMIYFLIAGTYTPLCLVTLRGGWGWTLLGINWSLAIAGIVLKLVFRRPSRAIMVVLFIFYLIMGWLIVLAWGPLTKSLLPGAIFWLISGGIFYTLGTVFFNMRRLRFTPQFGAHEIWHMFVLAGSFSHYWLMLNFI